MIESAPYWWVTCDATGCDNRCPGPEYEHTAWAELSGAIEYAEESGWRRDPAGRWFCDEHPRCETCDEPIDDPALAWVEGVAYHRACSDEALPPPIKCDELLSSLPPEVQQQLTQRTNIRTTDETEQQ